MTLSRSLHFLAISLLGASLTAGVALAESPGDTQTAEAQPVPNAQVVEDIVARVNDQIITESDYKRAEQQLEAEGRQQGLSPDEIDERKKSLLRDLIDQQLLLSKGKDLGITGETELVRRLDDIRKQNHLASMEDLEKAAAQQNVSFEDFKANIRNGIITQEVVRQEVGRRISISQKDVQNYYKAHESEFSQPESVRLSEILIPSTAEASTSELAAAQAKAQAIEAELKGGAKFEDLAKSSSSGPTAAQGGDLGEFRRGMLAPQLEEKTFPLKAGEYTEPIRTKQGFVILKVTEHNAGGDADFKQAEQKVEEAVFMQRMQPALRKYLTKLREEAYVKIKEGFVDSGASPNEMNLTYSAYVPPGPKKKKKFARTRFRGRTHPAAAESAAAANAPPVATAAPAAPAATAVAATKSPIETAKKNEQKAGKKEKIRFGQAPRESLPPAENTITGAQTVAVAPPSTNGVNPQSAGVVTPEMHPVNPDGVIGADTAAVEKPEKTRFGNRPKVHKDKKKKASEDDVDKPPAPTADELATQKVQAAPLGPEQPPKKKKEKGEKTRYAAKQKTPEPTPQPYMGDQQEATPPASTQAQPGGAPPAATAPATTPQ